jgi:GNAT superfamily N-acetyltransferase
MEQYLSIWKRLVAELPGSDIEDRPALAVRWADNAFPFWNALFLTGQLLDPDVVASRLQDAANYMRKMHHAGLVYIFENSLSPSTAERLSQILNKTGLEPALPITGMAGDLFPLDPSLHPALRIDRVTDAAGLLAYAQVNCMAYGFPVETAQNALGDSSLWKQSFTYMGYENGRPVTTASVIVNDGALYLALVATIPEARGNGYAESIVRHALRNAHQETGLTRTILHATDAGFPVYKRIGYHATAKIMAYKPSN